MTEENRIAELIKKYRKERNMTQQELSDATGINLSVIKNYEQGKRNPKIEQLKTLSDALNVSVNDFIDLKIENSNDVMSLVKSLYDQTNMDIIGKKDKNGNYIPSSISFKFNDSNINEMIAYFMKTNEEHKVETPVTLLLNKDGIDIPVEITKRK